jgi:hypothetical protein
VIIDYNFDKPTPTIKIFVEYQEETEILRTVFNGLGVALAGARGQIDHAKLVAKPNAQTSANVETVVSANTTPMECPTVFLDSEFGRQQKPKRRKL